MTTGSLEPFTVLGRGFLAGKFGVTNTLGSSLAVAGGIAAFFALNQPRTELAFRPPPRSLTPSPQLPRPHRVRVLCSDLSRRGVRGSRCKSGAVPQL